MKIFNNVDGQARLIENIADGVNTDDAVAVGQLPTNVIFESTYSSVILTVLNQTSTNGASNGTITKTDLCANRYANNCSYISDGTNNFCSITETGYFKCSICGSVNFRNVLSTTGLSYFDMVINLLDLSNKSLSYVGSSLYQRPYWYEANTASGNNNIFLPFNYERIYLNSNGTLNIGCYISWNINTSNSTFRSIEIVCPKLTVARV